MTMVEFLLLLLVAGVSGALGQSLSGYSRGGCLLAIVVGFIGTLVGTWLARLTGLPEVFAINVGGKSFPIIWSIIGGALFCAVLGLLSRPRTVTE